MGDRFISSFMCTYLYMLRDFCERRFIGLVKYRAVKKQLILKLILLWTNERSLIARALYRKMWNRSDCPDRHITIILFARMEPIIIGPISHMGPA